MSPESVEARVAALKQQVDDLAEDVRVFYPLVAGQEVLRSRLDRLISDHEGLAGALTDLKFQLQREEQERGRVRRAREEGERRDRWARWVGAGLLALTCMSSVTAALALLLK